MKIALIQLDIAWESKKANLEKAEAFAQRASLEKCDAIVFPEMFNTGFSMNVSVIAEDGYGETAMALAGIAKRYNINLIAGFPIKTPKEEKGRNMAFVYDRKGTLTATFTKMHPFSFAEEDKYYVPGENTVTFDIDGMSSSIFICYDLRFPEVFRRVSKDVQTIFVLANWPTARKEHWETLLRARAIENQCYIIGVNRTGTGGNGIQYPGASHIFDPSGNDICAGDETEEFLTCEFNPDDVIAIRSKFPFLKDMRYFISPE